MFSLGGWWGSECTTPDYAMGKCFILLINTVCLAISVPSLFSSLHERLFVRLHSVAVLPSVFIPFNHINDEAFNFHNSFQIFFHCFLFCIFPLFEEEFMQFRQINKWKENGRWKIVWGFTSHRIHLNMNRFRGKIIRFLNYFFCFRLLLFI